MMGKLIPVLLAVIGLAVGAGAGFALRPVPADGHGEGISDAATDEHGEPVKPSAGHDPVTQAENATLEYVKMNNQFVIPILDNGRVVSLIILSLSLEVSLGNTEAIFEREPKLRDAFLRVMFDHANAGGFRGVFTDTSNLSPLRNALTEMAQKIMGDIVHGVLISDIVRQDN